MLNDCSDLEVNPVKTRKLTNVRSDGKDDTVRLTPPVLMNLEQVSWFLLFFFLFILSLISMIGNGLD